MPATEYPSSSHVPLAFFGSILSIRRNHVVIAVDSTQEQELHDLGNFQRNVADMFLRLSLDEKSQVLSLPWLHSLLNEFLLCLDEFKTLLIPGKLNSAAPAGGRGSLHDRLVGELLERAVKALDVCNAVSNGVDSIVNCQRRAQIAVNALEQKPLCEAHLRRAKRALASLVASLGEKEGGQTTDRNWSFGRKQTVAVSPAASKERHFRSLSRSVSRTWSAAKQLQAMATNLYSPRAAEAGTLASPIYTMSTVLVFVMWALVAAIPCQDRGTMAVNFPVPPRQLPWACPMMALHEKIAEEWRKKEKSSRGGIGLLRELQRLEKCSHSLLDLALNSSEEEIKSQAHELADTCSKLEEELIPFQRRIREVFQRIIRNRTEVLDRLGEAVRSSSMSGV
ncbi:protein ROH1A-like [Aristolochia californica]|uniref:protein ROH1A-like n=1 Tax=Aristolochia californica TaxID=171875 RepID=UPI0035E16DBC